MAKNKKENINKVVEAVASIPEKEIVYVETARRSGKSLIRQKIEEVRERRKQKAMAKLNPDVIKQIKKDKEKAIKENDVIKK
jgi:hypothetical protein